MLKNGTSIEIYEDNAGGLYLCIMDADGTCERIFEGFETGPAGILRDAQADLRDDPDAYTLWDGDLVERLNAEGIDRTAAEIYDSGLGKLIATEDGPLDTYAGTAGSRALGISYIEVTFEACHDDFKGTGDFMSATCKNADGDPVKLIACEYMADHGYDEPEDVNGMDDFDDFVYPILRAEIVRQAADAGIDEKALKFFLD